MQFGEVDVMDIDGYDACKILEEISTMYALPNTLDRDYVYERTRAIFIREKILKESD